MHGKIISYDNEEEIGIIRSEDGTEFTMSTVDCQSIIPPKIGADVNFEPRHDTATEIYVISSEVFHNVQHPSSYETTSEHHIPKNSSATLLPYVIIGSILIFVAVLIYGELGRRKLQTVQDTYDLQIKKIETLLASSDCNEAQNEYIRAKVTRKQIFQTGLYYSLDSHAKQAHAIDIAECYAKKHEFSDAMTLLDIQGIHDPDYLFRASKIYQDAGDASKADEAKSMAQKYDTSMN